MAGLDPIIEEYEEQFDEIVPFRYFTNAERPTELAREAVDEGEPLTDEEWLREAGYSEADIEAINSGEADI